MWNCLWHFPMVCSNSYSTFVLLMVKSATWPFFEINGHTVTVSWVLEVSIFAGLEKYFHLFAHNLFSSSLKVLLIFCNSFCEEEISRADCKSMVSCRTNTGIFLTQLDASWSPRNFLSTSVLCPWHFIFRLTINIILVSVIILFEE